jgi:hypothetical protein
MKKIIGQILCLLGFHDAEIIEKERGIAGGRRCLRPGCPYRIEPVKWPRPPGR